MDARQRSQVIKEATRRWKVCEHGPDVTCQKTDPDVPRVWCDACVARALLELTVSVSDDEPESEERRQYPRMVEAQRRRREQERVDAMLQASVPDPEKG